MPTAAPRLCSHPSCGNKVYKGSRCKEHPHKERESNKRNDRRHMPGYSFYRTAQWSSLRKTQLVKQPYCETCESKRIKTPAIVVDHRTPHKGDAKIFFDPKNLCSQCVSCHNRKTAKYDGGYGNPIKDDRYV